MAVKIRCTECREKFPYDAKAKMLRCPNCGVRWDEDFDDTVISMPALRGLASKSADQVYRDIERTSEVRMQAAADMAGVPASEMSGLKITNLSDRREAGVMSAIPVRNSVTEFMQANPNAGGFRGAEGVDFSGAVQTGPSPNVGAKMRTALQGYHAQTTNGAVSDRPALETLQPGYRWRG